MPFLFADQVGTVAKNIVGIYKISQELCCNFKDQNNGEIPLCSLLVKSNTTYKSQYLLCPLPMNAVAHHKPTCEHKENGKAVWLLISWSTASVTDLMCTSIFSELFFVCVSENIAMVSKLIKQTHVPLHVQYT